MINDEKERLQRQQKLADLFFEMGMDLDLIEKISGIDKKEILLKRMGKTKDVTLTMRDYTSNMYLEGNSY